MIGTTFLCLLLCAETRSEASLPAPAMRAYVHSTVRIFDETTPDPSIGSGAILAVHDNCFLVLTAHHVVDPGTRLRVEWTQHDGSLVDGKNVAVVERDVKADLAVLKVVSEKKPVGPLLLGESLTNEHDVVFSVGCEGRALPTYTVVHIKGITDLRRKDRRVAYWVTDAAA